MPNPWLLTGTILVVLAGAIYWRACRWLDHQPPRGFVDELWDDFYGHLVDGDEVEL